MGEPDVLMGVMGLCEEQKEFRVCDYIFFLLADLDKGKYRNGYYVPGNISQCHLTVFP
jgi:hypothetical protein